MARELALLTGESMTQAVTTALRERVGHVRAETSVEQRARDLVELGRRVAERLLPDLMSTDDLYDDNGLPA